MASEDEANTRQFLITISRDLGIASAIAANVQLSGSGDLPSVFAVSDFATAAIAAAGASVAELVAARFGSVPQVVVSRRFSSLWFGWSIRPDGWALPAAWDSIAGDYQTADGWIRLHTNAPHHRAAALSVLGVAADKSEVARVVANWKADALETAVVERKGCAAAMRSKETWATHAQGESVNQEPLLEIRGTDDSGTPQYPPHRIAHSREYASSTSRASSPDPSRRAFWRASGLTCCASTRRRGTNRA